MRWRAMTKADLGEVADLAQTVHRDYPESDAVYDACLRLYAEGCHVLDCEAGDIVGYLIAHPGTLGSPPTLDLPLSALPEQPDCYFLHDLALSASARGQGMARAAVEIVVADASCAGFRTIGLIAVGDAHDFWAKRGFVEHGDGHVDAAKGYGPEARLLVRRL